jgi:iron complex outermembrane receptor protein
MKLLHHTAALFVASLLTGAGSLAAQEHAIPIDTLEVTASSRASAEMTTATRAVEVVTGEQIRRLPARSVNDVLQWAFGVDLMPRSAALADLSIRGSTFEQVLVLVDGTRVSDAQTGHFDLDLAVPLDQIERIEILRGPAAALYGADAMGGVVQIVTRQGGGPSARAETGSFGTSKVALGGTIPLGAAQLDLAGDLGRSDGHRAGTDYRMGQGRAALSTPLAGRTLRADLAFAGRNFGADGFYSPFPSFERTRTLTSSVSWRAAPDARLAVEPSVSIRRHHDDFVLKRDDPAYYRNLHLTTQVGGELAARYAVSPLVRLAVGGEAFSDRLESASLGDRSESRGALLAEIAGGKVGEITGSAGLRADWHEAYGLFWSPSASAAWWPVSGVRIRGSLGRSLRTPTWTERFYRDPANIGDPDLDPERAWSSELGADVYPTSGVRLAAAVWERRADGLIDWAKPLSTTTEPWHTRNVQEARYRGLEGEVGLDDLLGVRWTARANWLRLTSSAEAGFTSKYALRPLTRTLSLSAEREVVRGLDVAGRAERSRRVDEHDYTRLDARLAYRVPVGRIFLDVLNLTDEVYPDITGAPAAGRALMLGIDWRR